MKKITLLLALTMYCVTSWSQNSINLLWSEPFLYDNKKDGFFDTYVGSNNKYVYAKFSNLTRKPREMNSKVKIIAFHKDNMTRAGEVKVAGDGSKDKKGLNYYKTLVLDNVLYVIWTKQNKDLLEIYAESFDNTLKRVNPLKKVYEITVSRKATDNLLILYNQQIGNKILLGKEFAVKAENEQLKMEYKLLNEDFSVASSRQVTLPVIITNKPRRDNSYSNLECRYELADDGNIYVQSMIRIAKDERKDLKKRESTLYPLFMQVQPETGKLKEQSLKFSGKNTFNLSSVIGKNGVKVYGFFCDLEKDPKGNDSHGIFYVSFDSKNFNEQTKKLSYFDKKFLDELYAGDKENQKKGKGAFKNKEAKASDEESIDDNYVIEQVIDEGKEITLFCSIMKNWQTRHCTTNSSGGTTCYTKYYCTKNNITTFRLNEAGDIVWARNMDRSITYDGWNIYDVSVIKGKTDYYVVYGSNYQINAKKKNRRNSKSRSQNVDRFEYASFNQKTGDFAKSEYQVNKLGTSTKEKKYVAETNIYLLDNRMYTECHRRKGGLFAPKAGTGFLGVISANY